MPVYHRSQRLQIIDEKVDVTQLFGDRYRIVVRCKAAHDTEAWYEANKDEIFADFGTLYNAPMDVDGISSRTGEAYPNMALVSNVAGTSGGEYVVTFVYETLTGGWVKEQEDQIDATENGLRLLTRTEVASINTASYFSENDIGVVTITSNNKTLYLAGLQDLSKTDPDAQIGRIVTKFAEAGTLSTSERNLSEGVQAIETVFLGTEGSTTGPVYSKSIRDYAGFRTISVVNLQDNEGNSIIGTGENRVDQYERKSEFTYPGTVQPEYDTLTGTGALGEVVPQIVNFKLDPPVQTKIDATVSVIFQDSPDIAATDETYDDGKSGTTLGYWNPTKWATTYISGIGWSFTGFSETQGLRGYRADPENKPDPDVGTDTAGGGTPEYIAFQRNGVGVFQALKSENATSGYLRCVSSEDSGYTGDAPLIRMNGVADDQGKVFIVNGRRIYGETPFIVEARGGPENPIDNKYVLDIDIRPAFEDIDGNKYYKKTIVTATIPDNA